MLGLRTGDLIIANRNNHTLYSAVLERSEKYEQLRYKLSRFSTVLNADEYPKDVFWDDTYVGLSDSSGAVVLVSEEWQNTEPDGAKGLLAQRPIVMASNKFTKAKEIFLAIRDKRTGFYENAEVLLKTLGQESPSAESRWLVGFALWCCTNRVWEM